MAFANWRDALVAATTAATPFLFAWACVEAYAQRGYMAIGGEFGVFALPLLVAIVVYGFKGD